MNHVLDTEYTNRCGRCGLLWSLVGPPEFKHPRAVAMFKDCHYRDWKPKRNVVESRMESLLEIMKDV